MMSYYVNIMMSYVSYDVSIDNGMLRNVCPQAVEFYRSSDERRDQATSLRR